MLIQILVATQDLCHDFFVATQEQSADEQAHTPIRRFRAPDPLWEAYDSVCRRAFGRDRSEDLLDHMRTVIREYGDTRELELLEAAEAEIAERRARKGGRPRKTAD